MDEEIQRLLKAPLTRRGGYCRHCPKSLSFYWQSSEASCDDTDHTTNCES